MSRQENKIQGFNNLTKSLRLQHLRYLLRRSKASQKRLRLDEYNSKLRSILKNCTKIIEANHQHVKQDTIRGARRDRAHQRRALAGPRRRGNRHLDKSHIAAHTYPTNTNTGISNSEWTSTFLRAG